MTGGKLCVYRAVPPHTEQQASMARSATCTCSIAKISLQRHRPVIHLSHMPFCVPALYGAAGPCWFHGATRAGFPAAKALHSKSSTFEFTDEDLEAVFSDDDFESACSALKKMGLHGVHDLMRSKTFRNVADNLSSSTVALLLSYQREGTKSQIVRICDALADDIFHADSRVVGLFRQAADFTQQASRQDFRRPADVLSAAISELSKFTEGRHLERFHPLFASFVYGLGTRAGLSFVRALSLQQQAELLSTLASMHQTLRGLCHPRSGTLYTRPKSPGSHEGSHQPTGLLASCSDARSSVLHHYLNRFVSLDSSAPLDNWISSERAIRVMAQSPDLVGVVHPDVVQLTWERIQYFIDSAARQQVQVPIKDLVTCAISLISDCSMSSSNADLLLKSLSKMLLNSNATFDDVELLLQLMKCLWISKVQSRHALTIAIETQLTEIFNTTSPRVVAAAMQTYKLHSQLRLVCPRLFVKLDNAVALHFSTQPPRPEDLTDLPEFFWVMQSLRVWSPTFHAAASAMLAQMLQGSSCSDELWRTSLRFTVISARNGCTDPKLMEEVSRHCLQRNHSSRRSPFGRARQVNNGVHDNSCRGLLPPMHDFRDLTDYLQVLAYTGLLHTQGRAVSAALQEVHSCTRALRDRNNWEPLLKQSQGDRDVRNFVLACLKLAAVRYGEIISCAPLADGRNDPSILQSWLWDFIVYAVRDGRMNSENLPLHRTPQDDVVSAFESVVRAGILQLCRDYRNDIPVASHFVEDLALFTDIAWPSQKITIEIDGPVHYLALSTEEQLHWLRGSGSDMQCILDDKRPNLGFLSKIVNPKTSLRSAAFKAIGWKTISLSCFDVWPEYMSAKASRTSGPEVGSKLLDRMDVVLNQQGLWGYLK